MKPDRPAIHVVAVVLRRHDGRILVTSRPKGKTSAGYFEFPGGKVEDGEGSDAALRREIAEELDFSIGEVRPLIRYVHQAATRDIELEFFYGDEFSGTPRAREGQQLQWLNVDEIRNTRMLPADKPVIAAIELPHSLVITPEFHGDISLFTKQLERVLTAGHKLIQIRQPALDDLGMVGLIQKAMALAEPGGALVMANCEPKLAKRAGCVNLHLTAKRLLGLEARPRGFDRVSASVHDALELSHAVDIGVDFAILGPVRITETHPDATAIGWEQFSRLAATIPLPIYAVGGLSAASLREAWCHGAQGVAAIRGFWPAP